MEKWKDWIKQGKNSRIVFLLGIAGVGLIFFSGILEKKEGTNSPELTVGETVTVSADAYTAALEKRMDAVLESISGVGKVEVMITLESGTEYLYAQEIRSSSDYSHREGDLEERSEQESSYLLVEGKNGKEALVLQEIQPRIKGVVVVCQGGKNSDVRQSVTQAVTVALNITSSRVYVTALS